MSTPRMELVACPPQTVDQRRIAFVKQQLHGWPDPPDKPCADCGAKRPVFHFSAGILPAKCKGPQSFCEKCNYEREADYIAMNPARPLGFHLEYRPDKDDPQADLFFQPVEVEVIPLRPIIAADGAVDLDALRSTA